MVEIQGEKSKENSLYRQNFFVCLVLSAQNDLKKIMDEMFNPISNQIMPESIEERLELLSKKKHYEDLQKIQNHQTKIANYPAFLEKVKIAKKLSHHISCLLFQL